MRCPDCEATVEAIIPPNRDKCSTCGHPLVWRWAEGTDSVMTGPSTVLCPRCVLARAHKAEAERDGLGGQVAELREALGIALKRIHCGRCGGSYIQCELCNCIIEISNYLSPITGMCSHKAIGHTADCPLGTVEKRLDASKHVGRKEKQ